MKMLEIIYNVLLESYDIEKFKEKYVDAGKVSEDTFNEIQKVSKNKTILIAWLLKKVAENIIKSEDVYKFEEYLNIFEKNKKEFPIKDISLYKTEDDVKNFIRKCIEIREKNVQLDVAPEGSKENYVSPNDIQKLENVGVKFLGMSDGYQVFEIPNEVKDNEQTWKVYRDILGNCAGREQGAKIDLCTIAGFSNFKGYLSRYPGSSYFLMYNLSDPKSPYQFHFESKQFMDKNNQSIF